MWPISSGASDLDKEALRRCYWKMNERAVTVNGNVDRVVRSLMTPTRINLVLEPEDVVKLGGGWNHS